MNKLFIILLCFIFFLTGCSMNEIEEYSIVAGIAIDYEDEQYEVTYEIYKENNGETTSLTSMLVSSKGNSISEAMNNIASSMYQVPYLNHCLLLIFNENLLNNKLKETLNYLMHDVQIRSSCYIAVAEEKAKTILECSEEIKQVVSYNLVKKFDQSPKQVGIWDNATFNNIINEAIFPNGVLILPIVKYQENFTINNVYIINKDYKIFKARPEEIFVLQLFLDIVDEGVIEIKNHYFSLKTLDSKIKYIDNEVNLSVNMKILSYDNEITEQKNSDKKQQLLSELKQELKNKINNVFQKYQSQGIDPFYIYRLIEKQDNKLYQKIENEYELFFIGIKLNVNINIDILTSGLSEERLK